MSNPLKLFEKSKPSPKTTAGGPQYSDQIMAMAQDKYWTVLNTSLLNTKSIHRNIALNHSVNALKAALQTYGPNSNELPDLRQNKGKAKGFVFHGHAHGSDKLTYVLEWAIVDPKQRIMTLTNFDTHENYDYKQKPLSELEISTLLKHPESTTIMKRVSKKVDEAKQKVERIQDYYHLSAP